MVVTTGGGLPGGARGGTGAARAESTRARFFGILAIFAFGFGGFARGFINGILYSMNELLELSESSSWSESISSTAPSQVDSSSLNSSSKGSAYSLFHRLKGKKRVISAVFFPSLKKMRLS